MANLSELLRPFGYGVTKYRVMNVTKAKDKGSVAFYIDARDVMDRLDEVVGCENWQDKYTVLAFNDSQWAVECTLVVNGVAKTDVGVGDAPKDAYSDALKRAAVKFGIGRYLYDMDTGTWFPIDEWKNFTPESKKQIDELLRKNLARLGAAPAQAPRPSASTQPQAPVTTVTPPATNGNGGQLWQAWQTADEAKAWAEESGACANPFEAKNSLTKIVNDKFGGKFTQANKADVFAAYYEHQMDKLHEKARVSVNGAPEMQPA
jgi:hypothetical protein